RIWSFVEALHESSPCLPRLSVQSEPNRPQPAGQIAQRLYAASVRHSRLLTRPPRKLREMSIVAPRQPAPARAKHQLSDIAEKTHSNPIRPDETQPSLLFVRDLIKDVNRCPLGMSVSGQWPGEMNRS